MQQLYTVQNQCNKHNAISPNKTVITVIKKVNFAYIYFSNFSYAPTIST